MNIGKHKTPGAIALLVVWCAVMIACSSTRHVHVWNERYIVAARAHDEGRHNEARAHYAELLAHAPDEAARRVVFYRLALMFEEEQRHDEALAAYKDLHSAELRDEYGARALYRAARLIARRDGEAAVVPMYDELLSSYGGWVVAEHAVALLTAYHRQRAGERAALEALLAHRDAVRGKAVEGDYLMQVAELHANLEDTDAAVAAYDEVLAAEHLQVWWDDALWERAGVYRRLGAWGDALATLQELATAFQETSYFIGDYSSEHADDARLEMGRIYLEELGKPGEAVDQFDQFLKDFEYNRQRDDVAWMRLRALRSAGNSKRYERELERFSKDFPESRYIRRLEQGERP